MLNKKSKLIAIICGVVGISLILLSFAIPGISSVMTIMLKTLGIISLISAGVFAFIHGRDIFNHKKLYNEVYKFISPLEETYGGDIIVNNKDLPYYYKVLRKKNFLYVSFDKNKNGNIRMTISITNRLDFDLRLTSDIAYTMLGEKLFEGYGARYEEDSVERKLSQRIRSHKKINRYLKDKDRLAILERLLNAKFEIEFDYFNVNLKLDPINTKDNYYLFRGVQAIIELIGMDSLLLETEHASTETKESGYNKNKRRGYKGKRVGRDRNDKTDKTDKTDREDGEILFYGPLVRLIGMINDKRMFSNKDMINFNLPIESNNSYVISMLENEIYSNFTGKYIPIGALIKGFLDLPTHKTGEPANDQNEHKINISTSKGRINITDNKCGLSLEQLLLILILPFYSRPQADGLKFSLYSSFASICRYAFTDPRNFRFSFKTSNGKECHEFVIHAKSSQPKDLSVIIKKLKQEKAVFSSVKIRWDMLYPSNVKKYIKHKFINAVNDKNKIFIDGSDIRNSNRHPNKQIKIKPRKNTINHKFVLNLESQEYKKRLKIYNGGVLVKQLNETPWDIKIDLPKDIKLVKDMSDFSFTPEYNEMISEFFDFMSTKLLEKNVPLEEITNGISYLAKEMVEDQYVVKPSLEKIKNKLMPEKEFYCDIEQYETLKAFFGNKESDKIYPLEDKDSLVLWSIVLKNSETVLSENLTVLDKDIKKQNLKDNESFSKIAEDKRKIISHYINKSQFRGNLCIVEGETDELSPFCMINGVLYINISCSVLERDYNDPVFKYTIVSLLFKSVGLSENDIEKEVMMC